MSYHYLRLRRRCRSIVNQIELPQPFSIDALCQNIADRRDRGLYLHPLLPEASLVGVCGLWLATTSDDHIFYEQQTSRLHQEHIVLHELGHMLFNHYATSEEQADAVGLLLPDLNPRVVRRFLHRTNYTTRQEQEAEMLASVMRTTADRPCQEQPRGVTGKLGSALGIGASDDE